MKSAALLITLSILACNGFPGTGGEVDFNLYLVALEGTVVDGEPLGCNDKLVAVEHTARMVGAPIDTALRALLKAPDRDGLINAVRGPNLRLERVTVANGHAKVELGGSLTIGGVCDHPRIQTQLERTALQFDDVETVEFRIGGESLDEILLARD